MSVSRAITEQMQNASWIRRMFEIGREMRRERGADRVFDFTLGNPDVEPPEAVLDTLRGIAAENRPRTHGYMPNAGFPEVREIVARRLADRSGVPFTAAHIVMSNGAAGALNTILKSILDPGNEVIVLVPYFPEYRFYIENHGGRVVPVETGADFEPDVAAIERALTSRTRAVLLNSPNNPTGAVYSARTLEALDRIIEPPVLAISDEPYRPIVFDGVLVPETSRCIRRCALAWSWSKAMAIAGERIGYLAISPRLEEAEALANACTFSTRILGYINAPAVWQWVVAEAPEVTVPVAEYQAKRDLLCGALARMGYRVRPPEGSYYVFAETPIPDDIAFIGMLREEGILAVPGAGFGRAGYMRLSLTIPREQLERALAGFETAMGKVGRRE